MQKLHDRFLTYNKSHDDDNEDDPHLAASECVRAIRKLLSLNLTQETIIKMIDILVPIFDYTIFPTQRGPSEEGIKLLTEFLFRLNEIPPKLWRYFLLLNYILAGYPQKMDFLYEKKDVLTAPIEETGWGCEYIDYMIGAFQNYILKGNKLLITEKDPGFGLTLFDLLIKTIDGIYNSDPDGLEGESVYYITTLYLCILEDIPDLPNDQLIGIVKRCLLVLNLEEVQARRRLRRILTQIVTIFERRHHIM